MRGKGIKTEDSVPNQLNVWVGLMDIKKKNLGNSMAEQIAKV